MEENFLVLIDVLYYRRFAMEAHEQVVAIIFGEIGIGLFLLMIGLHIYDYLRKKQTSAPKY